MDELGALEIGLIRRVRDAQHGNDQRHRNQHGVRKRVEPGACVDALCDEVRKQRHGQAEQRCRGEVDPKGAELCHGVVLDVMKAYPRAPGLSHDAAGAASAPA